VPLEEAARGVAAAFVVEPPTPEGNLKTARKGLGAFRLTVSGRAAHAGTDREEGVSAIEELAHQIRALHALNAEEGGLSVNVGVVEGGTAENVVPLSPRRGSTSGSCTTRPRALRAGAEGAPNGRSEADLSIGGGWTRPRWSAHRAPRSCSPARGHGRELGLDLGEEASGGGSDGNLIAALGVPVLDGLGVEEAARTRWTSTSTCARFRFVRNCSQDSCRILAFHR